MKKDTAVNLTFVFYKENRIADRREYFLSDIRQVFQKWLMKKDIAWLEYYDTYIVVQEFITGKDGLNSTYENSQIDALVTGLKPDYKNLMNGINPVSKLPL